MRLYYNERGQLCVNTAMTSDDARLERLRYQEEQARLAREERRRQEQIDRSDNVRKIR